MGMIPHQLPPCEQIVFAEVYDHVGDTATFERFLLLLDSDNVATD